MGNDTQTLTLTTFLLARIAEDEAASTAAQSDEAWWVDGPAQHSGKHWVYATGERFTRREVADHIALHDPARVLAECEAKRRIVDHVGTWGHSTVEDCWYSCGATYGTDIEDACCRDDTAGECDCGLDWRVSQILGPLALPYAEHPDYREEWRP